MKQISILGCGWLGLPLARSLQKKGYKIKGSTTSNEKLKTLSKVSVKPFLVELSADSITGEIHTFLDDSETLIINIPPGMRSNPLESFSAKMELLIAHIEKSDIQYVLFVSSTSVFADYQGEVDEETLPIPDSLSGKELLKVENLLKNNLNFKSTIVRFGGLIGPERHPVKYLAGRNNLKSGNAPVNLIHLEDCIGIIEEILKQEAWGKVFHGVFPKHPLKKEYYSLKAKELGLQLPVFLEYENTRFKKVTSKAVTETLHYHFQKNI